MFYLSAFSEKEIFAMFKEFYGTYIDSEIMVKKDLSALVEMMAQPNLLGKEVLKNKIFPLMGTKKE